jgi:DNA-binding NtrC family response regulator
MEIMSAPGACPYFEISKNIVFRLSAFHETLREKIREDMKMKRAEGGAGPGGGEGAADRAGEIYRSLRDHLHFAPDAGHILLYGQRMLLFHAAAFAQLRRELIERLGMAQARELMMRLGYQQGFDDGARIREAGGQRKLDDLLAMGPRLREMEGFVRNHPISAMVCDGERGAFWGDYFWTSSFEAQAHLDHCGASGEPACWLMVGYANGYCTAVTGMPILWRETECVAMGHSRCRVVGRALSDWRNLDEDDAGLLQLVPLAPPPATGDRQPGDVFDRFVGSSAAFKAVSNMVRKVARADATVLFLGESGVGKERFARALHAMSRRADKPFVAINCAAIPQELVESELFGVERGAYTGADKSRPGRFERADAGTLFLDEIASLPHSAQGKLLRVLQEREVERVGDTRVRKVDVRIVAAANQDLRREVEEGRFRADLFYRLNVYPVSIPPLRERRDDIPLLVSLFAQRFSSRYEKKIVGLTQRAHRALFDYDWPGNVRELENILERAVILCDDGEPIDLRHLFTGGEKLNSASFDVALDGTALDDEAEAANADRVKLTDAILSDFQSFEKLEHDLLRTAMKRANGNLSAAARLLKMGRGQFEYRLKKYRDEPPERC